MGRATRNPSPTAVRQTSYGFLNPSYEPANQHQRAINTLFDPPARRMREFFRSAVSTRRNRSFVTAASGRCAALPASLLVDRRDALAPLHALAPIVAANVAVALRARNAAIFAGHGGTGRMREKQSGDQTGGQDQTLHGSPTRHTKQNGRPGRRQLNVLSARLPLYQTKTSLLGRLLAVGVALGGAGENLLGDQAGVLPDRGLDLG
jgi:hypothetical protein